MCHAQCWYYRDLQDMALALGSLCVEKETDE